MKLGKVKIEIKADGDAFAADPAGEIARILGDFAEQLPSVRSFRSVTHFLLRDGAGGPCGDVFIGWSDDARRATIRKGIG